MTIRENQILSLPSLADALDLQGPEFLVEKVFPGGMGACCRVVHIHSGKPYAFKLMHFDVALNEAGFRRFLEELKLWMMASTCDGVVEALHIFRINEFPCICARWMAGGDLRGHLSERHPSFFYKTMDRLIGTLEWVYGEYRIIHRDLKPSNVLLDEHSRAFVSDWGIARVRDSAAIPLGQQPRSNAGALPNLTQTGQFIGTISYSSPEQILGIREIDHRADIYSLGCMMFEWEVGSVPFLGASPEEIAFKHLEVAPPRLGRFFKKTAFGADKIIARCLEKKPTDRFQDYTELRRTLRSAACSRGVDLDGNYVPHRRHSLPLVGAGEIDKKGFPRKVVGRGEYAIVEMEDLEPYLREAQVLCGAGEWEKAAKILKRVFVRSMFEKLPDFLMYQLVAANLGLCLINLGRIDEALDVLRSISHAKKKPPEYFLNLSRALLRRNAVEAERVVREGLKEYPHDHEILGNLTVALLEQRKLAEAKAAAEKRLQFSRDVHSLDEMGAVLLMIGGVARHSDYPSAAKNYAGALRCLRNAKSLNPRYLVARFNLARTWFQLEEYGRSAEELNDIARLNLPSAYVELWAAQKAECMDRTALFEECRKFCDEWLNKIPKSIMLERIRAECMTDYFIGQEEAETRIVERCALEFFTDIIMRPDQRKSTDLIYMGRIKEWIGEVEEAFSLFEEAEKLDPSDWEAPYCRAMAYWRLKEFESAVSCAKIACTRGPWNPKTWQVLSLIQKSMGMKREAQEYERKANAIAGKREELRKSAVSRYN